jgi:hypothetical protein
MTEKAKKSAAEKWLVLEMWPGRKESRIWVS